MSALTIDTILVVICFTVVVVGHVTLLRVKGKLTIARNRRRECIMAILESTKSEKHDD